MDLTTRITDALVGSAVPWDLLTGYASLFLFAAGVFFSLAETRRQRHETGRNVIVITIMVAPVRMLVSLALIGFCASFRAGPRAFNVLTGGDLDVWLSLTRALLACGWYIGAMSFAWDGIRERAGRMAWPIVLFSGPAVVALGVALLMIVDGHDVRTGGEPCVLQ